jgi:hypothetical protein
MEKRWAWYGMERNEKGEEEKAWGYPSILLEVMFLCNTVDRNLYSTILCTKASMTNSRMRHSNHSHASLKVFEHRNSTGTYGTH